jgi:hypothetical protein
VWEVDVVKKILKIFQIYTWKMYDYGESRSGEYLLFYFKLLLNKNQVVGFLKSWKNFERLSVCKI